MKKSILILTSLSDNERNVAEAGLLLAVQLHKNVILLHSDDAFTGVVYYPGLPVLTESPLSQQERKNKITLLANNLKQTFEGTHSGQFQPRIQTLIMEGDLGSNVKNILKKYPIEMIAIGASTGSAAEHLLLGSETTAIAHQSDVPVLVIPHGWGGNRIRFITFATRFLEQDGVALQYLFTLRKYLGAYLDIVNIKKYNQPNLTDNSDLLKLITKQRASHPEFISYHSVHGKDLVPRLKRYCKENNSEVLALSRSHHSFLFRLLNTGTVDKYLSGHRIPLLIIPALESDDQLHDDPLKSLSGIVF